jgi:hypothetical protein
MKSENIITLRGHGLSRGDILFIKDGTLLKVIDVKDVDTVAVKKISWFRQQVAALQRFIMQENKYLIAGVIISFLCGVALWYFFLRKFFVEI